MWPEIGVVRFFQWSKINFEIKTLSDFVFSEVHKIAILDIRILNCDRNEENILVKK